MKQPISVNNTNIYPFQSRSELISEINGKNKILVAINAEKILNTDKKLKKIINGNIGYADGIGATMALSRKGYKNSLKIPGVELWLDIIRHYFEEKSFYFVGSSEEVINTTINKLKLEFKGINIIGYRNGYLKTDKEKNDLINDILEKKPEIVFVAMGSPKQEFLMQEMLTVHPAIYQGLGGSFDVYTGRVERAPKWWVKHNLEWAYRLLSEPTRIKRQIHLVKFFYLLLLNKL